LTFVLFYAIITTSYQSFLLNFQAGKGHYLKRRFRAMDSRIIEKIITSTKEADTIRQEILATLHFEELTPIEMANVLNDDDWHPPKPFGLPRREHIGSLEIRWCVKATTAVGTFLMCRLSRRTVWRPSEIRLQQKKLWVK
jgi:hypothetical protein